MEGELIESVSDDLVTSDFSEGRGEQGSWMVVRRTVLWLTGTRVSDDAKE